LCIVLEARCHALTLGLVEGDVGSVAAPGTAAIVADAACAGIPIALGRVNLTLLPLQDLGDGDRLMMRLM
jgi:hypothetical protein